MKQEIKERYPEHCSNKAGINYKMIMTRDNDSIFSCRLMNMLHEYETLFFYNYNTLYAHESADLQNIKYDELLAVDLDLIYEKDGKYIPCWGNHLTKMSEHDRENDQSANLNAIVNATRTKNNTFTYIQDKRAISVALQIASYYDLFYRRDGTPRDDIPEAVKMYFWATDAVFSAWYNPSFKHMAEKFIEELDIWHLTDVLEQKDKNDFYRFINKYNLSGMMWINEKGYMQTNIKLEELQSEIFPNLDLSLPEGEWIEIAKFTSPVNTEHNKLDKNKMDYVRRNPNLFSSVLPYTNQINFSILKELKNGGENLLKIHEYK